MQTVVCGIIHQKNCKRTQSANNIGIKQSDVRILNQVHPQHGCTDVCEVTAPHVHIRARRKQWHTLPIGLSLLV